LRYAYYVTCVHIVKDDSGRIIEIHCTYDPATKGGDSADGRKVKATLHWVSAVHSVPAEVRLYDHLFLKPDPDDIVPGSDWRSNVNTNSLETLAGCRLEPALGQISRDQRVQFERLGYFCLDQDSTPEKPVFNRSVTLKDTWAKIEQKQKTGV